MNGIELPKRKALGKGLESLLPRVRASAEESAAPKAAEGTPREIPVGRDRPQSLPDADAL